MVLLLSGRPYRETSPLNVFSMRNELFRVIEKPLSKVPTREANSRRNPVATVQPVSVEWEL